MQTAPSRLVLTKGAMTKSTATASTVNTAKPATENRTATSIAAARKTARHKTVKVLKNALTSMTATTAGSTAETNTSAVTEKFSIRLELLSLRHGISKAALFLMSSRLKKSQATKISPVLPKTRILQRYKV